ncbi:hypothetical protein [Halarchaeum nitratireducens]|uniref:Uncharacterized protein n=1 Tax=Halarchaeum nitratireducens TaxID=489913 RepID=A0A830GE04_9EURY|nr:MULTISPECIES: hypothetical protein [Halarchaeum]MBP2251651.1 chromate transport protein ChrA [Halarchaeum solikamskense]GGN23458.1 hypothetical protein GCM10009021_26220 [Halarchaeum nitratireducens]
MPSTHRVAAGVVVLLGVLALVYSMLIVQEVLLGVGVLIAALALAAIVYYGGADRQTLARATMAVTVVYGAVSFQLPAAVVAACVVYLTAWLTGPDSPLDAPDTTILPVSDAAANGDDAGRPGINTADTDSHGRDGRVDDPRR